MIPTLPILGHLVLPKTCTLHVLGPQAAITGI
jgi:hypothetical protein